MSLLQTEAPASTEAPHNKLHSLQRLSDGQETKFRRDTLAAIVKDARGQGHRPTRGQIKSLKGLLEGIDLGGVTCSSHIEIATRVPTSDPRSMTGHVDRRKIGEDVVFWVKAGSLTRQWKTIMLPNMQPTRKYIYRVARRVMTALKSLGRLVRRPRQKDNSHSLQRLYRDGGSVVSQRMVRPEPSIADLIRKYHGDEAADVYLATHREGEECLEVDHKDARQPSSSSSSFRRLKRSLRACKIYLRLILPRPKSAGFNCMGSRGAFAVGRAQIRRL
jgi:hypothetical protein